MKANTKVGFKQSEVGETQKDWGVCQLKDIARVNEALLDKNFKFQEIEYIDIDSVDSGSIRKTQTLLLKDAPSRAKRLVKKNDIIISTVRPNLRHFAFIKDFRPNTIVSTGFAVISCKKIIPGFLYYYLTSEKYTRYLTAIADSHTSVYPTFNPDVLDNSWIPCPPSSEQEVIAKTLSDLDSKIELNQQMNKTLEAIAKAIFKHWFVDFEFPNEEGKPYKSSGGEMVYNEELAKNVPKRWEVRSIDKVGHFLNGLALQRFPPKNENEYLPVIKIRELRQGVTESSDRASPDIPKEYVVEDGDVLFAWSGSIEVVIWTSGRGALNQHLFRVTSTEFPKWFYYYWILAHLQEYRRIAEGKATTMGHIQRHHLADSLVLVPDKTTLERMSAVIDPMFERIIQAGIESKHLSEIRDLLLPKLMSGKIRVPVEVR